MQVLHHGAGSSAGFDWFDILIGLGVLAGVAAVGWLVYRFATRPR